MSAGSLQDMEGRPLMSVTIPDYNVAAHLAVRKRGRTPFSARCQ
jgi:hypothetical protein